MEIKAKILEKLQNVLDPELGINVVDLGLIYKIEVKDGTAFILMTLTTPGCPLHDSIAGGVKRALRDIEGIQEETLMLFPVLSIKLFRVMSEKIIDLQNRLEEQILHNTYEQIVLLLLRLTKTNALPQGKLYRLTTHLTNRELANMIGTSRETVSRTLNQMKRKGIILVDDDGYYLVDAEQLEKEIFM
ncbi:iron-sulfur cluster assembly protein [Aeribacillus sp. FSL K6-8394]|uniref:iron-sulfur cluster assembly protein n=1 Tax=Aeribacillus sp. FSL K6-8394 TaxID=2954570 RepID=UPI0030F741A9